MKRRPEILLVEDNEPIRTAFSILLQESGYGVLQAGNGSEGMRIANRDSPALILLDLGLPDISGLEVARNLSGDVRTRDIPIVALTGRAMDGDHEACLAAGCAGYLSKPTDPGELLGKIGELLAG